MTDSALNPMSSGPFAVEGEWLKSLSDQDLVSIVRQLLFAEASVFSIDDRDIHVPTNITANDGGEDARIKWQEGPEKTTHLPGRFVQFQLKAEETGPAKAGKEVISKDGSLKPMVKSCLESGGFYRLICTHRSTSISIEDREKAMRDSVRSTGIVFTDDQFSFVDGDKLADWINHYPSIARRTCELLGRPSGGPFCSWFEQRKNGRHSRHDIVDDDRRSAFREPLLLAIGVPQGVVRVCGGKGVGKSRLVLDSLRRSQVESGDPETQSISLFACVVPRNETSIIEAVQNLANSGLRAIVVVDDCPQSLHNSLKNSVTSSDSFLSLVTITDDFRERQTTRTDWLAIPKASDSMIDALLAQAAKSIAETDRIRLRRMSLGNPWAALDMAESWGNERFVAGLGDDEIVNKIVVGKSQSAIENSPLLKVAKLIAVFGPVCTEGNDLPAVATIAGLEVEDIFAAIDDMTERGACRAYGRLRRLEPQPIAWHLAQSQLQAWPETKWDTFVAGEILPARLHDQFLDVVANLNTTDIGVQFASHVCRPSGPLNYAGVLQDEHKVSALARLSEIDIGSVLRILEPEVFALDIYSFASLPSSCVSHLVLVLERGAISTFTFERSFKLLLEIANFQDSATYPSGRQAVEVLRSLCWPVAISHELETSQLLQCIDDELESDNSCRIRMIVQVLSDGIRTSGFSRVVSAEKMGTRATIIPSKSRTWTEVFDHIREFGNRLAVLAARSDDIGSQVRTLLGDSVSGLLKIGLVNDVNEWCGLVLDNGQRWPEVRPAIGRFVADSINGNRDADPSDVEVAQKLLVRLEPVEIRDRINEQVLMLNHSYPYGETLKYDERESRVEEMFSMLADDVASRRHTEPDILAPLLGDSPSDARRFGKILGERDSNPSELLGQVESMWLVRASCQRTNSFIIGVLAGVATADTSAFDLWKWRAAECSELATLLPGALCYGETKVQDLERLIVAISSGVVSSSGANRRQLEYMDLSHLDETSVGLRNLIALELSD